MRAPSSQDFWAISQLGWFGKCLVSHDLLPCRAEGPRVVARLRGMAMAGKKIKLGQAAALSSAVTFVIYVVMVLGTMPAFENAGGAMPPDLRVFGYAGSEIVAFLEALGDEGRAAYLRNQLTLDTAFPGLLALSMILTLNWLSQRAAVARQRLIGSIVMVIAAAADYTENAIVITALLQWPAASEAALDIASPITMLKFAANGVAFAMLFWAVGRWWRTK